MRWASRAAAVLAGAAASLVGAGPVHADLAALVERFSPPPPRTFLIDVGKGTVGRLKVQEPSATYVRRRGIPDVVGSRATLSMFLRHWRLQGPVVTGVVRDGRLVEYNVVVGGVVFAFDADRRLEAVGLAAVHVERTLCVIPAACVVPRIP